MASFNFYIGSQETSPGQNPLDLTITGTGAFGNGAVRLMTNFATEIPNRANRTVAVWNAGMFPIPCLKTQMSPTAAHYGARVTEFLDIVAPTAATRKTDVIEVGNEPHGDLAFYLDCLKTASPLIKAKGIRVILGAMTPAATYNPPGGGQLTGSGAVSRAIANGYRGTSWALVDHVAVHTYNGDEGNVVRAVENIRRLFPISKGMWLTESGWPTPWGGEAGTAFPNPITESNRINKILNLGTALKNRAEDLNLRGWVYFANSDYTGDAERFNRCGLVNINGVKKGGGSVSRLPTTYAPGGVAPAGNNFVQSWQALNALPGVTSIGAAAPPPPPTPEPDPSPPTAPASVATLATPRLLEAVARTHTLAVKAEVLRGGEVIEEIEPLSGSVTYDAKAAIRSTCDFSIADDGTLDWIPTIPTAPLLPYGNEVRLWRGVRFDDGTEEFASLGIFGIREIEAVDSGAGLELRISGSDRAQKVSDAKFEVPHNVARGTKFTDAIRVVVEGAIGQVDIDFVETEVATPGLVAEEGEDRWEFAQGLATALGAELYFNSDGVLVLAPIPNPTQEYRLELVEGEDGVLLEASKRWSRTDAFNRVIVAGENSDINPPVRAVATDANPLSPTYYFGSFGKVPRFYSNQYVSNQLQAQDAAEGILLAELGITQQIDFGAVVNPTLRASDVVLIRRARLGISEAHVIDSLTIPLDAESSMTGTTRLVYPVQIESEAGHLLLSPETLLFSEQVLF